MIRVNIWDAIRQLTLRSRWSRLVMRGLSSLWHFEDTSCVFPGHHSKTLLSNCQHLLFSSHRVLVLQDEKWNLFLAILRAPEIVFLQLVSMQLTCEEAGSPCSLSEWSHDFWRDYWGQFSLSFLCKSVPCLDIGKVFLLQIYL